MPFRRAFSIASATRLLDQLDAPDLAGVERQRERDRADAAEEVDHPLAAGQAGELRRACRRGARPSRCSSGRRRRARSGSAGPRAPPRAPRAPLSTSVSPSRVVSATPAARVQRNESAGSAAASSSARKSARAGDQPRLELAGAPPLAHHEVAQEAASGRGGPRPSAPPRGTTPRPPRAGRRRARRRGRPRHVVDQVPAPGAVEAEHELARRRPSPNEYSSLLR